MREDDLVPKLHRKPRYPFAANISVVDVRSRREVRARTSNLSIRGCYVSTPDPLPVGTNVSLRVNHAGTVLDTMGNVVYSSAKAGMGIAFGRLDAPAHAALEKWLTELREK